MLFFSFGLAFSHDDELLVSASNDNSAVVYDVIKGKYLSCQVLLQVILVLKPILVLLIYGVMEKSQVFSPLCHYSFCVIP